MTRARFPLPERLLESDVVALLGAPSPGAHTAYKIVSTQINNFVLLDFLFALILNLWCECRFALVSSSRCPSEICSQTYPVPGRSAREEREHGVWSAGGNKLFYTFYIRGESI